MPQKLDANYVYKMFQERGCELLDEYKNAHTRMRFRCHCGNISTTSYIAFKKTTKCCHCPNSKKPTLSFLQGEFRNRNCELLEAKYKDKDTPMRFRCKCGRISTIRYSSFKRGSYCLGCSGKQKHTLQEIKSCIESVDGYKLLSKEYKNALTKLEIQCPEGHIYKTKWNVFQQGRRCPTCMTKNNSGEGHCRWIKDRNEALLRKKTTRQCFTMLWRALKSTSQKKFTKSYKLLGYTPTELRQRVTSHPNWKSVKDKKWHLDHVFPIKAFCDYGIRDLALINCLDNIRPVLGWENLKKHSKYTKEDFEFWLKTKGINGWIISRV